MTGQGQTEGVPIEANEPLLSGLAVKRGSARLFLEFEVLSTLTQRLLYSVSLLELFSNEANLNEGRFANFSHNQQAHCITIDQEMATLAQLQQNMVQMTAWIAEHVDGVWSLRPQMQHVSQGSFSFSFSNATTAVAFALCWK